MRLQVFFLFLSVTATIWAAIILQTVGDIPSSVLAGLLAGTPAGGMIGTFLSARTGSRDNRQPPTSALSAWIGAGRQPDGNEEFSPPPTCGGCDLIEHGYLLHAALQSASDAIVITRADLDATTGPTTVFVNRAYEQLCGWQASALVGRPARILSEEGLDRAELESLFKALGQGESVRTELLFYDRDNRQSWLDVGLVPLKNQRGDITHIAAFARDIAELKQSQHQMSEAMASAEAANQLKSEFLATMSHEIRTPLNGIIGMTNLLLATKLDDEQKSHAHMLAHSAETLLQLLNDILDLSKIEAGKLMLEPMPFNLESLIFEVMEITRPQREQKKLEMAVRLDPGLPVEITSDPGRVRQILLNLVSNAIKFTHEGHVAICAGPDRDTAGRPVIRINVADTGIGIAEEKLEHIFGKFSQGDSSTTRKFGGTGLGLAICRRLAEMLGGEITVTSRVKEGSTFSLTFGCEPASSGLIGGSWLDCCGQPVDGMQALVIDDAGPARRQAVELLTQVGMTCHTIAGLDELAGHSAQASSGFDLILLDDSLAKQSIYEVMGQLDEVLGETPPVLLLSSQPVGYRHHDLARVGFSGALEKPYRPVALLRAVGTLVHDRSAGFWLAHPLLGDARTQQENDAAFSGLQVLLAEDNPINAQVFVTILERWGAHVTLAGNGREAISIARSMPFDIIFMDCQMPELDGYEATRQLRRMMADGLMPERPIIALTANAMKGDRDRCLEAGMHDYMAKPAQARDIATMIRRWVRALVGEQNTAQPATASPVGSEADTGTRDPAGNLIDWTQYDDCADILGLRHGPLLEDFMRRLSSMMQELAFAYERRENQIMARLVHPFKSSAAQIGARALSDACRTIEAATRDKAGDNVDWTDLADALVDLRRIAEGTAGHLQRALGGTRPHALLQAPGEMI